jgi:O-antigen ligase
MQHNSTNQILKFSQAVFLVYLGIILAVSFNYYGNVTLHIMVAATMLWLALAFFLCKQKTVILVPLNLLSISILLFFLWLIISICLSVTPYSAVLGFFMMGSLPLIFWLFIFARPNYRFWQMFFSVMTVIAVVYALVMIGQYLRNGAMEIFFQDRNLNGAFFNLIIFLQIANFLQANKTKWFSAIVVFILTLAIIFVYSRGVFLGSLVGLAVLLPCSFKMVKKRDICILIGIIFFAIIVYYSFLLSLPGHLVLKKGLLDTFSLQDRLHILRSAVAVWHIVPWYGSGLFTFRYLYPQFAFPSMIATAIYVHNDYLQLFLELGYPGLLLLMVVISSAVYFFVRILKKSKSSAQKMEIIGLFAALVTIAVHGVFCFPIYIMPFVLISGIYLARINELSSGYVRNFNLKIKATVLIKILIVVIILIPVNVAVRNYVSKSYADKGMTAFKKKNYMQAINDYKNSSLFYSNENNEFMQGMLYLIVLPQVQKTRPELYEPSCHVILKYLQTAQKMNPYYAPVYFGYALLYQTGLEKDKALAFKKTNAVYKKAITLEPSFCQARVSYAVFLYKHNKPKQAIKVLRDGLVHPIPKNYPFEKYVKLLNKYSKA